MNFFITSGLITIHTYLLLFFDCGVRRGVQFLSLVTEAFKSSWLGLGTCDRSIRGFLGVAMITVGCRGVDGNTLLLNTP